MVKQKGLTLIEFLIAIVILGIIIGWAVPGFTTYLKNEKVRQVTTEMLAGLHQAKAEAIRSNGIIFFRLNNSGWIVESQAQNNQAPIIFAQRDNQNSESDIKIATNTNDLSFNGRGMPRGNTPYTIDVNNPSAGKCAPVGGIHCLRITVSTSGSIKLCDPALPTTDPRAC